MFAAALIFTRIPQYVLSPAIGALLPRASRVLSAEGPSAFDRFMLKALGVVGLVGVLMIGGTWLLGGWGLRLFAGEEFVAGRAVLVALAAMAAFYLLSETVSQGLFALGRGRPAALGWFVGLLAACLPDGARRGRGREGLLLPGPWHLCRRHGAGGVLSGCTETGAASPPALLPNEPVHGAPEALVEVNFGPPAEHTVRFRSVGVVAADFTASGGGLADFHVFKAG